MKKPSPWTGVLGAAIALTLAAGPAFAVQETKIGVTSASNLTTTGFPPVSPEHLLKIGVEVVGDERVVTTTDGRAQLLFLDHSALTIGPNSNLVLDKFVYDPDAGVGELAFSATKGIFRLVGGRISKKTPVTIKTSSGTIGIRGGIAMVTVQEGGPVEAIFLFGKDMTVCTDTLAERERPRHERPGEQCFAGDRGKLPEGPRRSSTGTEDCTCVTATRPGSLVTISSPGNVSDPVILTAEQISGTVQQLEQTPGKTTDTAVLVFQQEVKDAALGALAEPAAGSDPTPPPPAPPTDPPINTADIISASAEESVSEEIASGTPPTDIDLDNVIRPENLLAPNGVIGVLSATEADGDPVTFSITGDPDGKFKIDGNELQLAFPLNFEAMTSHNVTVQATDKDGSFDVLFTITVTDVPEILSGRAKRAVGPNPASFSGTNDGVAAFNIAFAGATTTAGTFDVSLGAGQQLTLPIQPGDFAAASSGPPPFFNGQLLGTGSLTADQDFVFYELTDQGDMRDVLVWAGVPTPAVAFPTSGFTFYTLRPDFVLRSNVPFINGSIPNVSGGGVTLSRPTEAIIDWDLGLFGGAAIVIDGAGTNQQSAASVFFGPLFDVGVPQSVDIDGQVRGSSFVSGISGDDTTVFISAGSDFRLSRDGDGANGNGFFGSTNPDYFVLETNSEIRERGVGRIQPTLFAFEQPYFPNVIALATPDVLGPRTDRTLRGFAGGLSRRFNGFNLLSEFMFDNADDDPVNILIETDAATGTLTAVFDVQEIGAAGNDNRLVADFGGAQRSAYFDDDAFWASESFTEAEFKTPGSPDDVVATNLYMVTSDVFQSSGFAPAGGICTCQFLEWGFWGGEIDIENGDIERIHLANWIAGDNIASAADLDGLPAGATADYAGHLIGTVLDNGAVFQAIGGFAMTFDFDKPGDSTIDVTGFDGVDYNADVFNLANGIYQADGQDASALGRDINFTGAFFGGGGNPVAETGGQFNIDDGADYTASGIFAGAQ